MGRVKQRGLARADGPPQQRYTSVTAMVTSGETMQLGRHEASFICIVEESKVKRRDAEIRQTHLNPTHRATACDGHDFDASRTTKAADIGNRLEGERTMGAEGRMTIGGQDGGQVGVSTAMEWTMVGDGRRTDVGRALVGLPEV